MTMQRAIGCGMSGMCIIICVILLIQVQKMKSRRDTDRWFRLAILGTLGMLTGDITNSVLTGARFPSARGFLIACNTLYFASSGLFLFGICAYVYTYMNSKKPQPRSLFYALLCFSAALVVFALITPFTGAIFYITAGNVYVRGPLWLATQVLSVLTFILTIYVYVRSWPVLNREEKVSFGLYFLSNFFGQMVQNLFVEASILVIMVTVTLLLVSMFTHTAMDEQLRTSEQRLEQERMQALQTVQKRQSELTGEIITALSSAVEAKDRYTNGHSQRVASYAREIVRRMGWSEADQEKVYYAGLLHDVGKIRVSDTIINKTSRLDDEEFNQIKLHTMAGYYILKEISSVGDFAIGARWHHERYDGKGYPNGLSGDNIPMIARIISVADAYDAMTSNRSYREVVAQETARSEIARGAGTQFDPTVAAIMLEMIDEDTGYRMRQPNSEVERTILAIDDDPMVHRLLEMVFRSQKLIRLKSARSGEEGMELLKKETVDLVLLDVEMPGLNGFDILSWIRENRKGVPVIFMTGDKDIGIIQKAEQLGVSDYLTKPLVVHMLMESVQNVLVNSGMMQ